MTKFNAVFTEYVDVGHQNIEIKKVVCQVNVPNPDAATLLKLERHIEERFHLPEYTVDLEEA